MSADLRGAITALCVYLVFAVAVVGGHWLAFRKDDRRRP